MNTFQVELQALVSKHVASAPAAKLLSLVETLSSDTAAITNWHSVSAGQPVRFINLDAAGNPTDSDHITVYDSKTGLTWLAEPVQSGKEFNQADAMKAASDVNLYGFNDWRAPTIEEQLSIIDYTKADPAVDTKHFKGPFGWTWTSTIAAAHAGFAWDVDLLLGSSFRSPQDSRCFVRAVRAGQQLGLLA